MRGLPLPHRWHTPHVPLAGPAEPPPWSGPQPGPISSWHLLPGRRCPTCRRLQLQRPPMVRKDGCSLACCWLSGTCCRRCWLLPKPARYLQRPAWHAQKEPVRGSDTSSANKHISIVLQPYFLSKCYLVQERNPQHPVCCQPAQLHGGTCDALANSPVRASCQQHAEKQLPSTMSLTVPQHHVIDLRQPLALDVSLSAAAFCPRGVASASASKVRWRRLSRTCKGRHTNKQHGNQL